MANYLDLTGLQALWAKIKGKFISQPSANSVTAGHVATFTKTTANGETTVGVTDSGYTIASNVPSNASFTDQSVTSVENHYKTQGADTGTLGSSTARHYVKTITTDAAGHVTGVTTGNESVVNSASLGISTNGSNQTVVSTSETPGKYLVVAGGTNKFTITDEANNSFDIPVTPSIANNVTGSGTSGNLAIWNGTNTVSSRSIVTEVNNSTSIPTSGAVKTYVDTATAGLAGAMHYCGWTETEISEGSTAATLSGSGLTKTTGFISGDVVSYGTKEFVWNGSAWKELGDEGSHALKTVTITGTGALSGGGSLESNRTIAHNLSNVHNQDTAQSYGPAADVTGSNNAQIKVPQISVDKYGHITAASEKTYTSKDTDRYVNSAAFADDTTSNSSNPVKMTLTRTGSDSGTVTANLPKVSASSAGVVPKGSSVSSQSQNTKFLREDGTWAKPSYTTNTDTHYSAVPVLGATASTSNASTSTENDATFLNIVENGTKSGGIQITGSGATSVSAVDGVLTISSTDNNTWKAANTSQEGYVPKLATGGGTIATQASEYVLTFKNGTDTAPVWRLLPTNAYNDHTYTVNDNTYSIKSKIGDTTTTVSDFTANQGSNDDFTLIQGDNVTFTNDTTNRTLTIASDNTWKAANTSQEGYVPKLATGGGTIATQASEYVLTFKNGTDTAPVWRLLPTNAYNDHTYTVNNGTYSIKSKVGETTTTVSDFTANQSGADDVTLIQGSNITLTPDATNRTITIAGTADTKVTSAANHYTPSADNSATLTSSASSTSDYAINTEYSVVTGVDIQRDAKGHVTGITTTNQKIKDTNTNTAKLKVSDTSNKRIANNENTGNYVQFTGGTNKFTVSDGTNSFEVGITPSISNNVTGSGLTNNAIVLGSGSSGVKTSSKSITTTLGADDTTVPTSKAVQDAITTATSGLTGAMHFIGTSTSSITDGGTQTPTIEGYTGEAKTAGNVVLYSGKEFVWTGTAWELFGDEGSYALKTIKVEGTGVLGGGGTLESNRTITHNTSGVHDQDEAQSYGPTANVSGSNGATIKVPQISVDKYGHIKSVTERTFTAVDHTYTVNDGSFAVKTKVGDNDPVSVSSTSANASSNSSVTFIQGSNVTLTPDATNKTITIASANTTYSAGTGLSLSGTTFSTKLNSTSSLGTIGTTSKLYAVGVDANGKLCVNVPWTDTNTKVTSAGNHYTPSGSAMTITNGDASAYAINTEYTVLTGISVNADAKGHVTSISTTRQKVKDTNTWTAWAGATSSAGGTAGYMPAPTSAQRTQFLRGDGTWVSLNNYSLPLAADGTRGGIQVGYTTTGKNYAVQLDGEKAYVNVPWTNTWTAWAGATSSANGTAGYMPAPTSDQRGKFLRGDGTWVSLNNYSLPLAADGTRGGVQVGYTTDAANKNYAVQLDGEKMYVNVPWTDHTYTVSNGTYSIKSKVGDTTTTVSDFTANQSSADDFTLIQGSNITFTNDTTNRTLTIAGTADTKVTSAGNHYTPSGSAMTITNGDAGAYAINTEYTVLTGIAVNADSKGHVTSISTTRQKIKDTNTTYGSGTAANVSGSDGTAKVWTGAVLKSAIEAYSGVNKTGTVTSVATGAGLTGGTITSSGTLKANLNSETSLGVIGTTSKLYAVGVDDSGKLCVNVPWTDHTYSVYDKALKIASDSGTATQAISMNSSSDRTLTISGGAGLTGTVSGSANAVTVTIDHDTPSSEDTANTYGPTANVSGSNGATIKVPQISVDAKGHITGVTERTFTAVDHTYTVNNGAYSVKMKSGDTTTTISDFTANQSGADDVTFIKGANITLTGDTTNRTITIAATDTTYTAGTGLTLSGTQFKHSNSVTAATVGTSSATSGSTLAVPYVTYDAQGHITATGTHTHTITGFLTSHQTLTNHAKLADTSTVGQAIVSKSGGYEWKTLGGAAYKGVDTSIASGSTSANLPTSAAVATFVSSALTSVLTYKGTIGSSGSDITALPASHKVGDVYVVKVAGTFAGQACEVGDYIICKTAGSSADDTHWDVITGENQVSNKSASLAAAGSSATIATIDGTDITITTPSTWTGVAKTGTITKVGNTSSGNVTVSSSNNTASWGSAVTVGSVGGVDLKFTMPGNPNSNTTYTFASGTTNGAFTVTPSGGSAQTVSIYGLGSAAYTASSAYATSGHNHTANIEAAASGDTNALTLAANTKYKLTAGGSTFIFTTPADTNTWRPVGTGASDAAAGNHTHNITIAAGGSGDTNQLSLSANTKYKLTAGGKSFVFTTPADNNTNTAKLKVSDTTNKRIANNENTGNYVQFTGGSNKFTITDGTNSFDVPITISGYAGSGHTHTTTIAADSGTSSLDMAANTKYKLTAGGTTFIFKTPADTNTWTAWAGATSSANGTAGYMPAPTSDQRDKFLRGDGTWVSLNNYSLPKATASALGGVIASNVLTSAVTITSADGATANRYYGVQVDSTGKAFVNIPWTDHTYSVYDKALKIASDSGTATQAFTANTSADRTLTISGGAYLTGTVSGSANAVTVTIDHDTSGVTAGSYGPTADVTGSNNATITIPQITVDAQGHVTSVTERTLTNKNSTYNFSGTTFYSGNSSTAEHNANNAVKNGTYYYTSNGPATSLGASTADGALYVQSHSDSWVGQIAQDYRNGRLFVRGKNNGTWQNWVRVANYNELPTVNNGTYSIKSKIGDTATTISDFTSNQSGTDDFTLIQGSNITFTNDATNRTLTIAGTADTKVTSAANHYAPSADSSAALTSSASSTSNYAINTEYSVVTGITLQRDAKGHVTGITTTNQKVKDTNTTYTVNNGTFKISANAGTAVNTLFTANGANATGIDFTNGTYISAAVTAASGTTPAKVTLTHGNSGATAGSYGPSANVSGSNGATISVPYITVDAQGHITSISNKTYTSVDHTYTVNNGSFAIKTKVGSNDAVSVGSTSANASGNTDVTFIQGSNVTLTSDANNRTITIAATNTDTKVTAVGNHYTPSGGSNLTTSNGTAANYALNTEYTVLTGVTIKADAAGHITAVSTTRQKIKDTNTTYSALTNDEIDAACA